MCVCVWMRPFATKKKRNPFNRDYKMCLCIRTKCLFIDWPNSFNERNHRYIRQMKKIQPRRNERLCRMITLCRNTLCSWLVCTDLWFRQLLSMQSSAWGFYFSAVISLHLPGLLTIRSPLVIQMNSIGFSQAHKHICAQRPQHAINSSKMEIIDDSGKWNFLSWHRLYFFVDHYVQRQCKWWEITSHWNNSASCYSHVIWGKWSGQDECCQAFEVNRQTLSRGQYNSEVNIFQLIWKWHGRCKWSQIKYRLFSRRKNSSLNQKFLVIPWRTHFQVF